MNLFCYTENIRKHIKYIYHADTRRIAALASDAKATYTMNRPCVMIQNICPHDAMLPNVMAQLIAIEFRHIYLANPIVLFVHIRTLSEAVQT